MKTVVDFPLKGKRVIVRSDLNVPFEDGIITDDNRLKESVETIKFISDCGGKVIILSHLGRVKDELTKDKYSLKPIALRLSELLRKEIKFIPYTKGLEVNQAVNKMNNRDIIMLENTRFEDLDGGKESSNNDDLASYWASLGDIFINDAFGTVHRNHASNVGIAKHLPSGIGFLMKKEIESLTEAINKPNRPLVIILGGSKVADKIGLIKNLIKIADYLLIGGGMCFTFLKALGYKVGSSMVDDNHLDFCLELYKANQDKILLPTDIVTGTAFVPTTTSRLTSINNIGPNEIGMDIGIETINNFRKILLEANTIIWNGPVGVFEIDKFNVGTRKLCEVLAISRAKKIITGGDTAFAVIKFGYQDKVNHISTGGGAALQLLEGKQLPGLEVINNR